MEVQRLLGNSLAGAFSEAVEHVPVRVTDAAETGLRQSHADVLIAVGGGSPIGLGKALALRTGLPLVAIPTTYSGSEMTSIYGETDASGKKTGRDARVAPRIILYDPMLTMDLPAGVSAASGMNALAHSVEALYAPNATAETGGWAEESIKLLARSLPVVVKKPSNLAARSDALRGAQLAGEALNATSMGLHHRICHVLGGKFEMPHARTHSVMLSYVTAYNFPVAPDAMRIIARALGSDNAVTGLVDLRGRLPLPASLSQLGLEESSIELAAKEVTTGTYPNPREVTVGDVMQILRAAYCGESPSVLCQ